MSNLFEKKKEKNIKIQQKQANAFVMHTALSIFV